MTTRGCQGHRDYLEKNVILGENTFLAAGENPSLWNLALWKRL